MNEYFASTMADSGLVWIRFSMRAVSSERTWAISPAFGRVAIPPSICLSFSRYLMAR